jgi:chromosome segregation ATPase
MNSGATLTDIQEAVNNAKNKLGVAKNEIPKTEIGSDDRKLLETAIVSATAAIKLGEDAENTIKNCSVTIYETAENINSNLESGLAGITPDLDQIIATIERSAKTKSETDSKSENLKENVADIKLKKAFLNLRNGKNTKELIIIAEGLNESIIKINDLAPDYIKAESEIKKCAAKL